VARPREFDEHQVLQKALELFWTRGFERCSIDDVVRATGLSRASLYGAFGDKETLFNKVVDLYVASVSSCALDPLRVGDPLATLREYLHARVSGAVPSRGPRGCFLLLASTMDGDIAKHARELLANSLGATAEAFAGLVVSAQAQGQLARHHDPARVGMYLCVLLNGVAVSARAGVSRATLHGVIDETLSQLAPDAVSVTHAL
jgi:AcrR family transcriptional regulator